jgi:hypothetical protein
MPTTYWKCDEDVEILAQGLIEEHYPDIHRLEGGLCIAFLFAESEDNAPLKKGGWPCEALCRVVPTRDRAAGGADVQILLDAERWKDLSDRRRRGLLHHELHHIQLVDAKPVHKPGEPERWECKLDTIGRPKVTIRPHDYEAGGFRLIAETYREDSPEVRTHKVVAGILEQSMFDFAMAPQEEEAVA